jgi:two-component system nitrate/nitrite sensor histidine kinase NarX
MQIIVEGESHSLHPNVQRKILYMIREGLRNVEKHADAQHVTVQLTWSRESLMIVISDDGQGFDPNMIGVLRGHYGLRIIQEYIKELNGTFKIISSERSGTSLILRLPV